MIKVEWKWNVPNALSLLRLFLVPVIVVTYWLSDPNEIPYQSDYGHRQAARPRGR